MAWNVLSSLPHEHNGWYQKNHLPESTNKYCGPVLIPTYLLLLTIAKCLCSGSLKYLCINKWSLIHKWWYVTLIVGVNFLPNFGGAKRFGTKKTTKNCDFYEFLTTNNTLFITLLKNVFRTQRIPPQWVLLINNML